MRSYFFDGLPPEDKVTDQMQREEFARQMERELGVRGLKAVKNLKYFPLQAVSPAI